MTKQEAAKLEVGSKVFCEADKVKGEVIEIGYSAAKVAWEDGKVSTLHFDQNSGWLDYFEVVK